MDISRWLQATEEFVQEAKEDKAATATGDEPALLKGGLQLSAGQRLPTAHAGSQDDGYEFNTVLTTTANVLEAVRERVMRCMRQVPIMAGPS